MSPLYAALYRDLDVEALDPTREQVRRVYRVADQCGYADDEIESMLRECPTREDCDALISRLARELADVVRGI